MTDILPGKGTHRCNRTACQVSLWRRIGKFKGCWNEMTHAWYCGHCARMIDEHTPEEQKFIRWPQDPEYPHNLVPDVQDRPDMG